MHIRGVRFGGICPKYAVSAISLIPGPVPLNIYTYKSPRTVVRGLFKHFFFKTVYLIISDVSLAAAFSIGIGIIVPDGLKPLPQYHSSNAAFPTSL